MADRRGETEAERKARLAAALRANLRRRKEHDRAVATTATPRDDTAAAPASPAAASDETSR